MVLFVPMKELPFVYDGEEMVNVGTHAPAILLSIVGLYFLAKKVNKSQDKWRTFGFILFGISLINLYLMSSVYHYVTDTKLKMIFRYADHISIYIIIAGTHTPYALTVLMSSCGWKAFAIMWSIALVGMALKILRFDAFDDYSVCYFVAMACFAFVTGKQLYYGLCKRCILLLLLGGASYFFGIVFYISTVQYAHAIWHLFVIGGSSFHYFSVLLYL